MKLHGYFSIGPLVQYSSARVIQMYLIWVSSNVRTIISRLY